MNALHFVIEPGVQHVEFIHMTGRWFVTPGWKVQISASRPASSVSELAKVVREMMNDLRHQHAPIGVLILLVGGTLSYRCDTWEEFENNVESIAVTRPPKELGLEVNR